MDRRHKQEIKQWLTDLTFLAAMALLAGLWASSILP